MRRAKVSKKSGRKEERGESRSCPLILVEEQVRDSVCYLLRSLSHPLILVVMSCVAQQPRGDINKKKRKTRKNRSKARIGKIND